MNEILTTENFKPIAKTIGNKFKYLEEQINEPQILTLENDCNAFSVGVDSSGTKYDVIESSESTIELNGRTLVNLNTTHGIQSGNNSQKEADGRVLKYQLAYELKDSQKYTLIFKVSNLTLDSNNSQLVVANTTSNASSMKYINMKSELGINKFVFTAEKVEGVIRDNIWFYAMYSENGNNSSNYTIDYLIVLEGDYTNVPIKYFEGLQSVKPVEIKSVGKNLLKEDSFDSYTNNGQRIINEQGVKVYKGEKITFSCLAINVDTTKNDRRLQFIKSTSEKQSLESLGVLENDLGSINTLVINEGLNKATFTMDMDCYLYLRSVNTSVYKLIEIQLEKNNTNTNYEPYKENIVTLHNIEPLRGLPNGVRDEAFIHDDKLVITRKCDKIIIDERPSYWYRHSISDTKTDNTSYFACSFDNFGEYSTLSIDQNSPRGIADIMKICTDGHMSMYKTENALLVILDRGVLSSDTTEGFKEWIAKNNITLVYQLATPTYEWYELSSPHLYKDGHVFIDSGSVPLTTTKHNINLSLRSAIDTNVEEIYQLKTEHGSRLTTIENNLFKESEIEIEEPCNTFTMSDLAINTSDTEIKLNGRTLVNLWGNKTEDFNLNYGATFSDGFITASGSGNWIDCGSCKAEMFKPETTYTIVANIISNTLNGRFRINALFQEEEPFGQTLEILSGEKGLKIYTLTSKSDISNIRFGLRSQIHNEATTGSIKFQCIILEGDYTNVPISYFEGLQSSEPVKLTSTHKNVINLSDLEPTTDHEKVVSYKIKDNNITLTSNGKVSWGYRLFKLPKYLVGKTIYAKVCGDIEVEYDTNKYGYPDGVCNINERIGGTSIKSYKLVDGLQEIPITHENFFLVIYATCGVDTTDETKYTASYNDIMISLEPLESYEPYIGDSIDLQIEPLRSLPNGICDTAELKDDKLIVTRRCGKVVFRGEKDEGWWRHQLTDERENLFVAGGIIPKRDNYIDINQTHNNGICDGFIVLRETTKPCIYVTSNSVILTTTSNNVPNKTIEEFEEWLSENPVTLIYQLSTSTTEEYDLRTLKLYKHFFAETGAIPLTSNVHNEHYNVKDMIEANTEELLNAKRYIAKLENTIDALIVRIEALETNSASVEE